MAASESGEVGRTGHGYLPSLNVSLRSTLNINHGGNFRLAKGAREMSWLIVENRAPICGARQEQGDSMFLASGWR